MNRQLDVAERGERLAGREAWEQLTAGLPVSERCLQLAGVSTAVLEGGEGPPAVLLHGPNGHAAHWMAVIPDLVESHRVVVPDLPGHGASVLTEGDPDAARLLAWLGELVERTCESPPVLVGYTLGGAIAARFAAANPDRVDRLVLVDTFGLCEFDPAPDFGQALQAFTAEPTERTHTALWEHCALDLNGLRDRIGSRWEPFEAYNLDRARTPEVQTALGALMKEFGFPAIPPAALDRITVPTTLIWGRHDLATRLEVAVQASRRYGWPLHVIEDCGDEPPFEQPAAFLKALRRPGDHGAPAVSEALERFQTAERALLDRFGVEARPRRLRLEDPALGVRVLDSGEGEPTVFVHGGGAFGAEWAPLLGGLSGYRCISVDRPGSGGTEAFDYRGVDLRRHAVSFLDGVLDALELERAHFVGQSMGGLWSLWLALERPHRVASLALLGCPAMMLGTSTPLGIRLLGVRGLNRLMLRLQPPSLEQSRRLLRNVFGAAALKRMTPEFVETVHRAHLLPGALVAFRTLLERVLRLRGGRISLDEDELRRVETPTLFIWGTDDCVADPRVGRRACEVMPNARLEVIPGAGHGPWWDEPGRCAALVASFLDSNAQISDRFRPGRS